MNLRIRYGSLAMAAAAALGLAACPPPLEGERCNPLLFADECAKGLTCGYPENCGVAFCCPTDPAATGVNPSCAACPAPDAGSP